MTYRADAHEELEGLVTRGRCLIAKPGKYYRIDDNFVFPQKKRIVISKVEASGLLKGSG